MLKFNIHTYSRLKNFDKFDIISPFSFRYFFVFLQTHFLFLITEFRGSHNNLLYVIFHLLLLICLSLVNKFYFYNFFWLFLFSFLFLWFFRRFFTWTWLLNKILACCFYVKHFHILLREHLYSTYLHPPSRLSVKIDLFLHFYISLHDKSVWAWRVNKLINRKKRDWGRTKTTPFFMW